MWEACYGLCTVDRSLVSQRAVLLDETPTPRYSGSSAEHRLTAPVARCGSCSA